MQYWPIFYAEDFPGVLEKITATLAAHQQESPGTYQKYNNWLPNNEGIIAEPTRFPDKAEIATIQASGCDYLFPSKLPPKKKDEDMFINPNDIPEE
jgi:hypothetical protein